MRLRKEYKSREIMEYFETGKRLKPPYRRSEADLVELAR